MNCVHMAAFLIYFIGSWAVCHGFLLDDDSCANKCGQHYDPSLVCQCNTLCPSYSNCCPDYRSICLGQTATVSCASSFADVTEALWQNDVNRLDVSEYRLNLQSHVTSSTETDHSASPLFSWVEPSVLSSKPTYRTFLALQDLYQPSPGHYENLESSSSGHHRADVDHFVDSALNTTVFGVLLKYLECQGILSSQAELRTRLHQMWFMAYPRHPGGVRDTSGFEHVMVGEYKDSTTVNGLHSWLAFYHKERNHRINYYGYVVRKAPNLLGVNFSWNGHHKALGGFFLGTSPEFDLALYTLCALTADQGAHDDDRCDVTLHGQHVRVTTFDVSYVSGLQIATAYPAL